mgnify:CR=1 FL=1
MLEATFLKAVVFMALVVSLDKPFPWAVGFFFGNGELIVYDMSGKEIWRWETWNPTKIGHWRLVPSPVAGSGVALACAPKRSPIYAVDMKNGELLWKSEDKEVSSDVCTPLYHDGHFYVLNGEFKDKRLCCVEARSGKVRWMGPLGTRAKIEASPTPLMIAVCNSSLEMVKVNYFKF